MAKTSMKLKQARPAKFSTRRYNRCKICGRPHAYLRDYGVCRICSQYTRYSVASSRLSHTKSARPQDGCKKTLSQRLPLEGKLAREARLMRWTVLLSAEPPQPAG